MPSPVTEMLNGGIVTARAPKFLRPGELQRGDECVYRESDPALHSAPARSVYNSVAFASKVKGMAHLTFDDNRTDQLLAHVGTTLRRSDFTALTGTFAEITGPRSVAGTISGTTTFTATTGFPFRADVIGSQVYGANGGIVEAVSGQNGSTGYYSIVTLATPGSNGAATLGFDFGVILGMDDAGTEIFSATNYINTYFATSGTGLPRRISWRDRAGNATSGELAPVLISRPMGLAPVTQPPSAITTITGKWNEILGAGWYWFVITEIYAPKANVSAAEKDSSTASEIIESAYLASFTATDTPDPTTSIGRPVPVNVTTPATQGVRITLPAVTNNGVDGRLATNWGIYMSGPTEDSRSFPSLATFRRIRTPTITTYAAGATVDLTEPTLAPQAKYAADEDAVGTYPQFTNPTFALGAPDKVFATSQFVLNPPNPSNSAISLDNWGFDTSGGYATAAIVGVEVTIWRTGRPHSALLKTASKSSIPLESGFTPYQAVYHGGPLETLGAAWVIADLATIAVEIKTPSLGNNTIDALTRLEIDAVRLTVFFSGGTINLDGPPYRVVTYRSQVGTTINDPANLPPPTFSTGDFFQGSYVVNDILIGGLIRWSLPGKPEAFPQPYFMKMLTRKRDQVTCVRSLGQILVVGMKDNIKRVNWLPTELDTEFQQTEVAHEALAEDHGIVGPLAAEKFDMPGGGTFLFYVSTAGFFITDGITVRPANLDINHRAMMKMSALSTCQVRVYPRDKWIVVYFCPAGASHTKNTRALVFSYAQDKIKDGGMLPAIGPITVSGRASCPAMQDGEHLLLTANEEDFKIYVEDQGTVMPTYQVANSAGTATTVKNTQIIRTRRIRAAGTERLAREERIYVDFVASGSASTATGTTTADSATVTSSAAFGSIVAGMRVKGANLKPGTIVIAVASASSLTLSQPAHTAGSGTLTFDTGTVGVTVYGSNVAEAITALDTSYNSTLIGDNFVVHNDNAKQSLELLIQKVALPDASLVDLGVGLRLNSFTYLMSDLGLEQNRAA